MNIFNYFKSISERRKEEERQFCIESVKNSIQIREFEGKLHISYNDTPLVSEDKIKGDICSTLEEIRHSVMKYQKLIK